MDELDFSDNVYYTWIPSNAKPGDIYCHETNTSTSLYHTFMIASNSFGTNEKVMIYHFDGEIKKNAYIKLQDLKEYMKMKKVKRIKKVILSGKPLNRKKRLELAENLRNNFYNWGKYHPVINNCQHFIYYCCYGYNRTICGQSAFIPAIIGYATLFTAMILASRK